MDPKLGDKTPVYMEWMEMYHPEEYVTRYRGRRTYKTTGINPWLQKSGDIPDTHFGKDPEEQWGSK